MLPHVSVLSALLMATPSSGENANISVRATVEEGSDKAGASSTPTSPAVAATPSNFRAQIGVEGAWFAGNLNQIQLGVNGIVSNNGSRVGQDLVLSAYQLWMQPAGAPPFVQVGDDLTVSELPYIYLSERIYALGLAHYSTSQLRQLDHRVMGGASIGYAPVRLPEFLVRAGIGAFFEYSLYPGEDFSIDVSHQGSARAVPRLGLNSNGWYRPKGSAFSGRYLAWFFVNPLDPRDYRYNLDISGNLRVAGPVSVRVASNLSGSTVVLDSVAPFDARTTVGIALSWPAPP